ncbi:mannose-specific lectin-like [Chanos chanos]|uniref:Mannose-specific lectin-like n=1 Tax=Chanos chanos TaxID=29144 RepID=A0A6J2VAP9_CHACN|nr:mannose-specific lectin-like [Chanos chanos]
MSRNYMSSGDELRKGDCLLSNNRSYEATFQEDGNFVIYNTSHTAVWATDTGGWTEAHSLRMQIDGNVVMYSKDGHALWETQTSSSSSEGCVMYHHFYLTDDGNLVLERDLKEVWNSARSKGHKLKG